MFDLFVNNCKKLFSLGECATTDEKLEPLISRCSFRQYIPSNPSKYGIKLLDLVDSRTFYKWNMEIYVVMQPESPYKLEISGNKVVMRLIAHIFNTESNLTVDNWYTSTSLAKDLLDEKLRLLEH